MDTDDNKQSEHKEQEQQERNHTEMNTIIAKYYELMQDSSYYEEDERGKFSKFCLENQLNEAEMKSELFDVDPKDCIYNNFDPDIPSFDDENKYQKYTKDIEGVNDCLKEFYGRRGKEYEDEDKGAGQLFTAHLQENGIDFGVAKNDFTTLDINDFPLDKYVLCDMDDNFPYLQDYEAMELDEEEKLSKKGEEIFNVIQHAYLYGNVFPIPLAKDVLKMSKFLKYCWIHGQPPRPQIYKVTQYDLSILDGNNKAKLQKSMKMSQDMIEKQMNKAFYENIMNHEEYASLICVGYNQRNYDFLLYLMDAYQRERVYRFKENDKAEFNIKQWVESTEILKNQNKMIVDKEFIEKALISNMKHHRKPLELSPHIKIYDNISIISKYITSYTKFIQKYLMEQGYTAPFSVDCMIAVKDCKVYQIAKMNEQQDDEKKTNPNVSEPQNFDKCKNIGDIKNKLTNEECPWVNDQITDITKVDDKIIDTFKKFRKKMIETDKNFPTNRRFCLIIDRRKNNDEIIIYLPPTDCNTVPTDHIPQSLLAMSSKCLIPNEGYNDGKGANLKPITIDSDWQSGLS